MATPRIRVEPVFFVIVVEVQAFDHKVSRGYGRPPNVLRTSCGAKLPHNPELN